MEASGNMTIILDPNSINLSPETVNLLEEVSEAAEKLNSLKPFDEDVDHRVTREFLPDRVTASLNIEGIAVTRRQTLLMMDSMTLSASGSKEERELLNALRADEFVYDLAKRDEGISSLSIREINKLILDGVRDGAGSFRDQDVQISGSQFQPPDFMSVPPLVSEMIDKFQHTLGLHPVVRAAWLHGTFTKIHPFIDGNGRTGRLIQDFVLMQGGLYPTGIPSSMRDNYYDALEQADNGKWDDLCQMICQVELNLISRVQAIVDEVKSRGQFVSLLAAKAKEKKVGRLHKQYVVWRQRMENFLHLLTKTCDEVNNASDVIQIRTETFEIISFEKWKEVSDNGRAANTWAAKQTWLIDGVALYRTILFFRRHDFRPDDVFSTDVLYGTVALKITGGEPILGVKYNFDAFGDAEIHFREILWVDERLQLLTFAGETRTGRFGNEEVWKTEELTESSSAIQGLIEDIFMRKLGLGA
ncbi:Fic family protein [Aliishimia ponticola]|uniref:Fic family protein n=2 Tax=Aliishimia ponticola TaxID=2499833 RepID=A0A4S4NB76_9RHOB|nr:Fic family protein [Aliishimia ponticola]